MPRTTARTDRGGGASTAATTGGGGIGISSSIAAPFLTVQVLDTEEIQANLAVVCALANLPLLPPVIR